VIRLYFRAVRRESHYEPIHRSRNNRRVTRPRFIHARGLHFSQSVAWRELKRDQSALFGGDGLENGQQCNGNRV